MRNWNIDRVIFVSNKAEMKHLLFVFIYNMLKSIF